MAANALGINPNATWAGAQRDAALGGANVPINQIIGTVARTPGGVPGQNRPNPYAQPSTIAPAPVIPQPPGGAAPNLGAPKPTIPNFGAPGGAPGAQPSATPPDLAAQFQQQFAQLLQQYLFGGGGGYPTTYGAPGGLYGLPSGGFTYGSYGPGSFGGFSNPWGGYAQNPYGGYAQNPYGFRPY